MFLLVFFGITILTLLYLWRSKKDEGDGKGVMYMKFPFYMSLLIKFVSGLHPVYLTNIIYKFFKDKTQFACFYIFFQPIFLPVSLESLKNVFTKDFQHFHDRDFYINEDIDPLSANLFGITGERWTYLRKHLSPLFTSRRNKNMLPSVKKVIGNLLQTIDELNENQKTVEIKELLAQLTTDVIGCCALGIECNSLRNKNDKFRQVATTIFTDYFFSFKLFLLDSYLKVAHFFGIRLFTKDVNKFFLDVVKEIIEYREETGTERYDIIDILRKLNQLASRRKNHLDENEKLTLPEVTAQCFVYFMAGMETTSNALTFTLYELANNPDIQEKARQSVYDVLKKHNGEITYEAISEMTYLEQCINESLRKFPPVVATTRRVTKDYEVPGSNQVVPKGASVVLLIHSIQNDPAYYPNPEKYDPDRFEPQEVEKRNHFTFVPFGTGPRFCIGYSFAMMQMKTTLSTLLTNYRFVQTTTKPMEFSLKSFTLTSKSGVYLKIEKL